MNWEDVFPQPEKVLHDLANDDAPFQDIPSLPSERSLAPEGFYPLKVGMRVKHPKFGAGKVTFVEGMDEDQKATILFQSVGSKRLKVCYAHLEILE